jgi:hypothetical protein
MHIRNNLGYIIPLRAIDSSTIKKRNIQYSKKEDVRVSESHSKMSLLVKVDAGRAFLPVAIEAIFLNQNYHIFL